MNKYDKINEAYKKSILEASRIGTQLRAGDSFSSDDGETELKVKTIEIRNFHLTPEAYIYYEYKKGKKRGKEWNNIHTFSSMVRKLEKK